jgi:hypothetical protein
LITIAARSLRKSLGLEYYNQIYCTLYVPLLV